MKLSVYAMLILGAFLSLQAAEPVEGSTLLSVEARKKAMKAKNDKSRVTRQISFETNHIGRPAFDGLVQQNKQKTEKRNN